MSTEFKRWAEIDGATVRWGNVIGGFIGQTFCETFATAEDAIERRRQALALEPIGKEREPVALTRKEGRWA